MQIHMCTTGAMHNLPPPSWLSVPLTIQHVLPRSSFSGDLPVQEEGWTSLPCLLWQFNPSLLCIKKPCPHTHFLVWVVNCRRRWGSPSSCWDWCTVGEGGPGWHTLNCEWGSQLRAGVGYAQHLCCRAYKFAQSMTKHFVSISAIESHL